eukprot:scaffold58_cov256-Pinguiococcus_pyrenoidosus.AAC.19
MRGRVFCIAGVQDRSPSTMRSWLCLSLVSAAQALVSVSRVPYLNEPLARSFVRSFWGDDLTSNQEDRLVRDVSSDLNRRYCDRADGRGALLLLSKGAKPIGFAGVEVMPHLRKYLSLSPGEFNRQVLGSSEGGDIALASEERVPAAVLANLVVDPRERRKGHANHLMRCGEQQARKWGLDAMYLSVQTENSRAQKLYQSRGYREVCKRTGSSINADAFQVRAVRVPEICMQKKLAPAAVTSLAEAPPTLVYTVRNLL